MSKQEEEQMSLYVRKGTKAGIKDALAKLRLLDGEAAPETTAAFVQLAIDQALDLVAKRFHQN